VDRERPHPIARAFRLGSSALVIGIIGALASSWASATDLAPAAGDPRFDRIDAFVREEMRGARIPGIVAAARS
jgi:hypothetical protein